jgi:two-component system cell cycle sensor histidine kinase/response regulator CckA
MTASRFAVLETPSDRFDPVAALRQSEERFDLLCEAAFDGVLIHEKGTIVAVTEKCCRIFGCGPDDVIGRSVLDFTAPHMHETVLAAIAGNQNGAYESVGMRANGEFFPLEASGASSPGSSLRIVALRDLTAQRRAETALRERERQLALLVQAAFDGIAVVEDGTVREANHAFAGMLGYDGAELPGQPLARFIDSAEEFAAAVDSEGAPGPGEARAIHKDGRQISIEISGAAIGPARQIYAIRDVTSRRQAEERLAESEGRYRDLVEHSHDLICSHDFEGRIVSTNAAAARTLGIPMEELQTLNIRDLLAPGVSEADFDRYLETLGRSGVAEGKMKVLSRDGSIRIWEYRNTVMTIGLAAPLVRGFARDVTDREEALREMQRSEARYRSIIENTSDVIGILDPLGVIRYHSPSLERALGRPSAELTGTRLLDHVHPDDAGRLAVFVIGQSSGNTDGNAIKVRLRERAGTYRSFDVVATQVVRDGVVRSIIINARDVTERDLLERQLEQAQRLTGLGRLAATVAHEFNNVLMGMLPFTELLQRPAATPAMIAKCGAYLSSSIQRGKRVALDILRYTQPSSPVLETVCLEQWWRTFEPEVRGQLGNSIVFTTDMEDGLLVSADTSQLAQVFTNLINNARDAMPSGGSLRVSARKVNPHERFPFGSLASSSPFVTISVADTGTGIDPDVIGHVFDPLFTTKETGGTGLGLAVAHQAMTRQGGHIFVESERGRGTTFHLFLRVAEETEPATAPLAADPAAVRTQRVLLIEDEPSIVEGVTDLLTLEGFVVRSVSTGAEAAVAVEQFQPEIVVLDLGLPDMSGLEVARRLRVEHPRLPIVFATGHGDRERVQFDGQSWFLQKPFELSALLELLTRIEAEREGNA